MRRRGPCTVCAHPERARAELQLAAGATIAATARKLGMSEDALQRHWKRHVPESHRKAMRPGAEALAARMELAGQIAEESTNTLDHLKAARAVLWQMIVEERAKGSTALATMAAAQYTKVCGLIAKMTGELATSPLVQHTTLNVTTITQSPEFQQLMDDVAAALEPYPEARRAVFERFAALECPDDRVIDVPQVTHVPTLET